MITPFSSYLVLHIWSMHFIFLIFGFCGKVYKALNIKTYITPCIIVMLEKSLSVGIFSSEEALLPVMSG